MIISRLGQSRNFLRDTRFVAILIPRFFIASERLHRDAAAHYPPRGGHLGTLDELPVRLVS